MQTLPLAKHELLASVDDMLAPETLSELVRGSISEVRRSPLAERMGTSQNRFEWVSVTVNGREERRYALKRILFKDDWFMNVTNDTLCRSITLWQYGLLDRLSSHIDHTIIACSRDRDGWAILMKDVSAGQHPALDIIATPRQIHGFLDAQAFMHAAFWADVELKDAHLGLNDNASLIGMSSVPTARQFAHVPGVIPSWILEGWEIIQTLLEPDAKNIYCQLMLNPPALYEAVARYPVTLTHGDYRGGGSANLSYMVEQPVPVCAFDWQHASCALMTIDMTWFINRVNVRSVIAPHDAAVYYCNRLEHYLGFRFDPVQWQAMLELGLLADALRMGCFDAYFAIHASNEEFRTRHRAVIEGYNKQIRAGARWL
jgi:hypothetical protein